MCSRHLSVVISASPSEVYDLASDPARLPDWAAGLAAAVPITGGSHHSGSHHGGSDTGGDSGHGHDNPGDGQRAGAAFELDSPMGRIHVRFLPRNSLGVLDHVVTLPDGSVTYNPLRVVPHPDGAEVVFTMRQQEMADDDFERDCRMVTEDLDRLKRLAEGT